MRSRSRVSGDSGHAVSSNPYSVNVPVSLDTQANLHDLQKDVNLTDEEIEKRARVIEEIESLVRREDTEENRAILSDALARFGNSVHLYHQHKAREMQEDTRMKTILTHNRRVRKLSQQKQKDEQETRKLIDELQRRGVHFE